MIASLYFNYNVQYSVIIVNKKETVLRFLRLRFIFVCNCVILCTRKVQDVHAYTILPFHAQEYIEHFYTL